MSNLEVFADFHDQSPSTGETNTFPGILSDDQLAAETRAAIALRLTPQEQKSTEDEDFISPLELRKKSLLFDPNVAIRTAITEEQTLTPIVTLRDWDMASS